MAPPLMRPLTPSSVGPSLQQVEQQLVHAELQLDSYSSSLTAHFQLLQASIERDHAATSDPPPLPLVKPTAATAAAAAGSGGGVTSTDSTTERPSTRSGRCVQCVSVVSFLLISVSGQKPWTIRIVRVFD